LALIKNKAHIYIISTACRLLLSGYYIVDLYVANGQLYSHFAAIFPMVPDGRLSVI